MIHIKNKISIQKMAQAGYLLAEIFESLEAKMQPGVSSAEIDALIDAQLQVKGLISKTKGYKGYKHSSCISINDEVVHGVPRQDAVFKLGDLVKVDVCASWNG